MLHPERFHEFEQTFRKTVAERLELLRSRQKATGEQVTRIELEPEIVVVMLEMLVNNFFGGSVSYEELRDGFVPALLSLIDHMIGDTVAHRLRAPFGILTGRNASVKLAQADFEALTDIALAGRSDGLGLWKQFKSDATDEALRSNIRVFLAGALEATSSFASWALSHLSRAPDIQDQIYEEVKAIDVYDPENLGQAVTLNRVLEETLRLTPSLYFLPRRATADTWVETADNRKMFIPQGTHVLLDVWHANRCEEHLGGGADGTSGGSVCPGSLGGSCQARPFSEGHSSLRIRIRTASLPRKISGTTGGRARRGSFRENVQIHRGQ